MDLSCFSVACCLFIEVSMSSTFNTVIGNKNAVINIFSNTAFTCLVICEFSSPIASKSFSLALDFAVI